MNFSTTLLTAFLVAISAAAVAADSAYGVAVASSPVYSGGGRKGGHKQVYYKQQHETHYVGCGGDCGYSNVKCSDGYCQDFGYKKKCGRCNVHSGSGYSSGSYNSYGGNGYKGSYGGNGHKGSYGGKGYKSSYGGNGGGYSSGSYNRYGGNTGRSYPRNTGGNAAYVANTNYKRGGNTAYPPAPAYKGNGQNVVKTVAKKVAQTAY